MPEVRPLKRYPAPHYPDAYTAADDPTLLLMLPRRFASKPAVRLALGAVISLGLIGCAPEEAPIAPKEEAPAAAPQPTPSPALELYVPLFEHGDGMGSYGCVSVAPPVFLSEEEAICVIRDEAAKYGLDFSAAYTLDKAQTPLHRTFLEDGKGDAVRTVKGELELDGYDAEKGIGFEFVSRADLIEWRDPKQNVESSVDSYFAKDAAMAIAENNQNVAVFYDPMSADYREFNYEWPEEDDGGKRYEEYAAKYDEAQRARSIEDLRAQVKDFLEWLKAQGVI